MRARLLLLSLAAIAGCAGSAPSPSAPTSRVEPFPPFSVAPVHSLPFEDTHDGLIVTARVNGSEPLRLLFDTGMLEGILLKDAALVEKLGLTRDREVSLAGFGIGPREQADIAAAVPVEIGSWSLHSEIIVLRANAALSTSACRASYDGIVGKSLLDYFVVRVDHERGHIDLYPPDADYQILGSEVPAIIEAGKLTVAARARFDDGSERPLRFVVDTGSHGTFLLLGDDVVLPTAVTPVIQTGTGIQGANMTRIGILPSLTLGSWHAERVVVGFLEASPSSHSYLGNDVLSQFNVIYDSRRSRIVLEPRLHPPERRTELVGVGVVFEECSGKVKHVFAGSSAAEAGLISGDVIVSAHGRPLSMERRGKEWSTLGQRIPVVVERPPSHRFEAVLEVKRLF